MITYITEYSVCHFIGLAAVYISQILKQYMDDYNKFTSTKSN